MARATMFFPPDFLWGTATAAHQVEGNNQHNDWWVWEQEEGRALIGGKSGLACNWWENAEADLDRAAEMGTNAHRLSLEWSRIEPEPSVFDERALGRYREILEALHQRGMEPMVTLHYFTNPLWLVDKRDFDADVVVDYFRRYVAKVVTALGDLIPKWVTFNEPLVYVISRYLTGRFPAPDRKGWTAAMRALGQMLRCHAVAYHTIKETYPEASVGVAKQWRPIEPHRDVSRLDAWWANRVSWFFNELWMECMTTGRLRWPIGRGRVKDLAGAFDFIGINYYSRSFVRFPWHPSHLYLAESQPASSTTGDNGFQAYPAGLFPCIKETLRHRRPIYITENGLPDNEDKSRSAFLLRHLRELWRAISFNFPVMGYYYRSLVDGFDWDRGWSQHFGLIEVDPETQERRWRPSAKLYGEICQGNNIGSNMAERYAPEILEEMFPGRAPS